MSKQSTFVGIAGGSCSGKTAIAQHFEAIEHKNSSVLVLGLDSYYKDFSGVPSDRIEVDVPEAIDHACLVDQLRSLAGGEAVEKPVYDYVTHSRAPRGERVEPAEIIVVEGLFALYWPEVRELLDMKAFVTIDHGTALSRRIARDVAERGRSEESVRAQYAEKVRPNYERHVLPTKAFAGLVLNGADPVEKSARRIGAWISENR